MRPLHGSSSIHAIVPVKILRASKARLAPTLSASNRSRLSLAMLTDVLRALRVVRRICRITVVSGDNSLQPIVRRMGAHFLWEGRSRGLNKALTLAIRDALRRKARSVLILPSDVPLITSTDVERLLNLSGSYAVVITPSKDGDGTNALFLKAPNIINPAFGKSSFKRHLSSANRKCVPIRIVRSERISRDIDGPKDLASITRYRLRNETGRFLRSLRQGTRV